MGVENDQLLLKKKSPVYNDYFPSGINELLGFRRFRNAKVLLVFFMTIIPCQNTVNTNRFTIASFFI